ncbi:MAG: amino acid ABC transporter substrate-binding protein [Ramlibacter sp.]|nr:amino acid ABC transporter substrate-binding protein [Ramlibacter sp.]
MLKLRAGLAGALLTLPPLLGLSHAHALDEIEKLRSTREIVIAHRDASIPFSYLDANRQPIDYSMDVCARLVEALRRELKLPDLAVRYLPVTSATRIPAIAGGKASLECGSTTNNAERRKQVDYTIAHFISAARFVVRASSGMTALEDLTGKTVVSTRGTTNLKTLQRVNDERLLRMKIVDAGDHAEAFAMVGNGQADAFAMDDVLLFGLRANAPRPQEFSVIGKPMTIEPYAVMLPRDQPAFKKIIDDEMRRLIFTGQLQQLYQKWFTQPIPPRGINLELPMSFMLRESFKFPSDKVGDLVY